jgi:hypothetical protein
MRKMRIGVVLPVLVGVAMLAGLVVWRLSHDADAGGTRAAAAVEPAHEVTYEVSSSSSEAGQAVRVRYTGADGGNLEVGMSGPVWTETVRTAPGGVGVSLDATGQGSGQSFLLACRITVDGVQVGESRELLACATQFSFSRLKAEQGSAGASPAAPACRYVTLGEMTSIVGKVVRSATAGERTSCRYVVEGDAGEVTLRVDPDGKPGGPPAERVRGLLERAWFSADGADGGELRVSLPGGDVFVVDVALRGLDADPQEVAVGSYREARPRLREDR